MNHIEQAVSKAKRKTSLEKSVDESFSRLEKRVDATNQPKDELDEKLKASIGKIVRIPINMIQLNDNVRNHVDIESDNFKALLSSIKKHGIQQNVVVELQEVDDKIRLVCISGHRRITAAQMIESITHIPALIQKYEKESHKLELALAENMLREDLHSLDIANVFAKLIQQGLTREEIAKHLGKSDKTVRYYLKMANWSADAKKFVREHENKFPARILMNRFACKKYDSDNELIDSLKNFISGKSQASKTNTKKADQFSNDLTAFLDAKNYSDETRQAVFETLSHFKLI